MYILRVVWIIYLDAAAAIPPVIGVKRGKEELQGGFSGRASVWLRPALHLLRSCRGPICDRRTVENQSNRLRRYRSPLLAHLVLFCLLVCPIPRTHAKSLLGLGRAPGRCSLARLAVRIRRISSSSLKQFLARNCVFVRKLVAQRTELNLRDILKCIIL